MKKYLLMLVLIVLGSAFFVACTDEYAEEQSYEELATDKDPPSGGDKGGN